MRPLAFPRVSRDVLGSYLPRVLPGSVLELSSVTSDTGEASQLVSQPWFPGVLAHWLPLGGIAADCYSLTCIDRWQCRVSTHTAF